MQICAGVVDTTVTPEVYTQWSPPSEILVLQVPVGTDTNALTISGIKWPAVAALNGWAIFANTQEDLICGQQNDLGLPDSITLLGPISRQTYAVPDYDINLLRLRAQVLIHGGVLGGGVDTVTSSPPAITSLETADLSREGQLGGARAGDHRAARGWERRASPRSRTSISSRGTPRPASTTLDRDPVAAGVQAGDIFTVCFLGIDN